MAQKLDAYDWTEKDKETKYPRQSYPWHQWLDGNIWRLFRGPDFQTHPLMMERIIRTRATGYKCGVQIRHEPYDGAEFGAIVLQRTTGKTPTTSVREASEPQHRDPKRPIRQH